MQLSSRPLKIYSSLLVAVLIALFFANLTTAKVKQEPQEGASLAPRIAAVKPAVTSVYSGVNISHVVVKFRDDAGVRLRGGQFVSLKGQPVNKASSVLDLYLSNRISRLIQSSSEERLDQVRQELQYKSLRSLADMNGYYRLDITDPIEAEEIINELNKLDIVEIAYFQPMPEVAIDIAPPTGDFSASQDYREVAPGGVDAVWANTQPGGDGTGVKIVDIEFAWQSTHEDLDKAVGGFIGGTPVSTDRDHGTAVIGEMIAGDNGYGVTGICPGADIGMISVSLRTTADAMLMAADSLNEGDLMLIELHAPGPRFDFTAPDGQLGFVCMEYWQANYDALLYAWAKGIVVIEAAGNGSENFDDVIYGPLFDTTYRNSHAIIAGAGAAPVSGSDRQRLSFSNYGERVNLQGYGHAVYTTGYGDLFAPNGDENQFYTTGFSGTSSASPIVTGAVACLQGYYLATFGRPLDADEIRTVLNATGSPQLGNTSLHIGPRPDLAAAFPTLTAPGDMHTSPRVVKEEVLDGSSVMSEFYIVNRSLTEAYDFNLVDTDTLAKLVTENWLVATPSSGVVPAADSVQIEVLMDATVIVGRVDPYKGIIEINYGPSGSLDSLLLVPVFFTVLCNNTDYEALASNEPSGPTYSWVSAKDIGTKLNFNDFYAGGTGLDPLDDGTVGPVVLNFDFPFFQQLYNQIYIGVNGGISFTDEHVNAGGYYAHLAIPGAPFSTFVSAYWNDLIFRPSIEPTSGIYIYQAPTNDSIVIEWYRVGNFNVSGDHTCNFEIIITSDGTVKYQYKNIGSSGLEISALVGIQEIECKASSFFNNNDIPAHQPFNSGAVQFNFSQIWVQAGDANNSGDINIGDITFLVSYLFGIPPGPAPTIPALANANCDPDTQVNIADITFLVAYLFGIPTGPEPCYFWLTQ